MEDIWKVSEECRQGIMMVSRNYKNGVWMIDRGCLEANMKSQLEDKLSQGRLTQERSSQEKSKQDRLS